MTWRAKVEEGDLEAMFTGAPERLPSFMNFEEDGEFVKIPTLQELKEAEEEALDASTSTGRDLSER